MFKYCILVSLLGLVFSQTNPVDVSIYYESKCPLCRDFIAQIVSVAREQLGDAMALQMLPYGHAVTRWEDNHWQVRCQYGPDDCFGNELEACVLQNKSLTFDTQFNFIDCLERASDFNAQGRICAALFNLDWDQIYNCATSDQGFDYLLDYGNATVEFFSQGGDQFTPYVSYNNVKNDSVAANAVLDFIGETRKHISDPKPYACN